MRRMRVMGRSGSGKSTFAIAIARRLRRPYDSPDALFWRPGRVRSAPAPHPRAVIGHGRQPSRMMDGNHTGHGGSDRRRAWNDRARQGSGLLGHLAGLRPDQRLATVHNRRQADDFLRRCPAAGS